MNVKFNEKVIVTEKLHERFNFLLGTTKDPILPILEYKNS